MSGDENGRFYMSLQDINSRAIMPGDKDAGMCLGLAVQKTMESFLPTIQCLTPTKLQITQHRASV
jgi:hypothetical protein